MKIIIQFSSRSKTLVIRHFRTTVGLKIEILMSRFWCVWQSSKAFDTPKRTTTAPITIIIKERNEKKKIASIKRV